MILDDDQEILVNVRKVDWDMLREQKDRLTSLRGTGALEQADNDALDGIIHFIDDIQDQVVDSGQLASRKVFGFDAPTRR
jgi:hypothetical protein